MTEAPELVVISDTASSVHQFAVNRFDAENMHGRMMLLPAAEHYGKQELVSLNLQRA